MTFSELKKVITIFVAGFGLMFTIATLFLMKPDQMWRWINDGDSIDVKVDRGLSDPRDFCQDLVKKYDECQDSSLAISQQNIQIIKEKKAVIDKLSNEIKKSNEDIEKLKDGVKAVSEKYENKEEQVLNLEKSLKYISEKSVIIEEISKENEKLKKDIENLKDELKVASEKYENKMEEALNLEKKISDDMKRKDTTQNNLEFHGFVFQNISCRIVETKATCEMYVLNTDSTRRLVIQDLHRFYFYNNEGIKSELDKIIFGDDSYGGYPLEGCVNQPRCSYQAASNRSVL